MRGHRATSAAQTTTALFRVCREGRNKGQLDPTRTTTASYQFIFNPPFTIIVSHSQITGEYNNIRIQQHKCITSEFLNTKISDIKTFQVRQSLREAEIDEEQDSIKSSGAINRVNVELVSDVSEIVHHQGYI
jgi:hypothetical protein